MLHLTWEKETMVKVGFTPEQIAIFESIEFKDLPKGVDEVIWGLLQYAKHTQQFMNSLKWNIDCNFKELK
jgi:hypothetical protein